MKILVIGSGGREHALCWKLAQSHGVEVFACPGNPGMARVATCVPASRWTPRYGRRRPDGGRTGSAAGGRHRRPLPRRRTAHRRTERARRPNSKAEDFRKELFAAKRNPDRGLRHGRQRLATHARALGRFGFPVVLKADGLAAGKGVVIAHDRGRSGSRARHPEGPTGDRGVSDRRRGQLHRALRRPGRHAAGADPGPQSGVRRRPGPNTGGMGAYCDAGILTRAQTPRGHGPRHLPDRGSARSFTGFLYAGLMMTADGPKVLEFNVRLGDPETQPLMHRMESDFVPALMAAARRRTRRRQRSTGAPDRVSAWCSPPAAIPALTKPARRSAASQRRKPRARPYSMPGHAHGRWPAGNCRRPRAGRDGIGRRPARPRSRAPTTACARSNSRACTTASDIGSKGLSRR